MVRVALVASLLGAAEGGFRMTGYRSLGCLSTSMGWGDSEIRCALARRARAAHPPTRPPSQRAAEPLRGGGRRMRALLARRLRRLAAGHLRPGDGRC